MSRMPANTSLNTLAPRIASPGTIPRYSVVAWPSTDGVVVRIIPLGGPLTAVVHPIRSSHHDDRARTSVALPVIEMSLPGTHVGAGFTARRPELNTSIGTIQLTPKEAASISDEELRDLVGAALDG